MRMHLAMLAALASLSFTGSQAHAADLINLNFETGSVGEPGSPINGWQKLAVGAGVAPTISTTGRTFLTGGNDQALVINPYTPGATGSFSGGPPANYQGVVFRPSTPISVPAGSNVYMLMEHFADFALPGNAIKYRFAAGKEGNGSQFLGFDSVAQDTFRHEISYEVRTDGTERAFQGLTREAGAGGQTRYFRNSHWTPADVDQFGDLLNNPVGGDASNNFLDRSYVSTVLFRPNGGSTDMEGQVRDSFGTTTRQDQTFTSTGTPSTTVDDQPAVSAVTLDYFVLALSRYNSTYDGPGGNVDPRPNFPQDPLAYSSKAQFATDDPLTNPGGYTLANAADLMLGVKSLRFGIAAPGDVNLDGSVNAADRAAVQANLGMVGATFFDGDFDNDGDVDANDLAFTPGTPGDANGDGAVDLLDLDILGANFGASPATLGQGDFNADNTVDLLDLDILGANFGSGSGAAGIPEPTAVAMSAFALSMLGACRRR